MNVTKPPRQSGFTVIELIVVAVVLTIAGILTYNQINAVRISSQDSQRKTAINAMHYALEEVYYKQNQSYPATLSAATLPSVDPALFTDPDGFTLGKEALSEEELTKLLEQEKADTDLQKRLDAVSAGKQPNYHYDAVGCDQSGKCKGYTLRADLINEAQYIKKNRKN